MKLLGLLLLLSDVQAKEFNLPKMKCVKYKKGDMEYEFCKPKKQKHYFCLIKDNKSKDLECVLPEHS